MKNAIIVIKSSPNSLIPLPVEKRVFEWDMETATYSEEAMHYIEILMAGQRAFTVDTSEASEYDARRVDIVFGAF